MAEWNRGDERVPKIACEGVGSIPPGADRLCEIAYRRGFMQGTQMSVDALRDHGASAEDLQDWLNDELFTWRYRHPLRDRVNAPWQTGCGANRAAQEREGAA